MSGPGNGRLAILITLCVAGGSWIWLQEKNAAIAAAESKREFDELRVLRELVDHVLRRAEQDAGVGL